MQGWNGRHSPRWFLIAHNLDVNLVESSLVFDSDDISGHFDNGFPIAAALCHDSETV